MAETVLNDALLKLRRKRRKKWIWTMVVLLVIGGGGTAVYLKLPKEQAVPLVQDETLKVERGDVSEKLDTSGTVQASKEVKLNFTSTGENKLAAVNVKAGDKVKRGQVLALLDSSEIKMQIQSASDNLEISKSKLAELEKGPKAEDIEIQKTNVLRAKMAVDTAQESFELEEAESQKKASKKQLEQARKAYEDQKFLHDAGAVSNSEMEQAEQALDKAQTDYDGLDLQFRKIMSQKRRAIAEAEIGYRSAMAELRKIEVPADASNIQSARIEVRRLATELEQKKNDLNKLQVTAPWDGVILKVNGDVGTSPTAPFIVMNNSDSNNLKIGAKISQNDIVKVKKGLSAVLSTNAYPGESFPGKVQFVSPEASTDEGMTTYLMELSVHDPKGKLKTGMVMNVSVILGVHKNVLFVPAIALRSEGGQDGVYFAANPANPGARTFKPVELGFYTPDRVELKSGVKEGDTLIVPAPEPPPDPSAMGGMQGGF
ncbi:efflux RND transporter periplasmic adaptor subunit [Paenibacillus terrae]|uniref:Efflux RND transporter periplasmic adaptor subunit n=1 Tax=Paenibacillus terrae TaxID=159743 RepID=A0A4U2PSK7_9BACL|nr:efflux RND transporter periplasmic adaptor subunit [Paenibacillus terrae]TKH41310.1 efflux RND transporter periplasmic adaptor subunit [Paenibacillus terrae]